MVQVIPKATRGVGVSELSLVVVYLDKIVVAQGIGFGGNIHDGDIP